MSRIVTRIAAVALATSFAATAQAACAYEGSPVVYVGCIYDGVLANAADILVLSDRTRALEDDVADLGTFYTTEASDVIEPGGVRVVTARCEPGDQVISGGWELGGEYGAGMAGEHIIGNASTTSDSWTATLYNDTHNTLWFVDIELTVRATCVTR